MRKLGNRERSRTSPNRWSERIQQDSCFLYYDLSIDTWGGDAFTSSVSETCREREAGCAISPHSSCTIIQKTEWSVKLIMGIFQIKLKFIHYFINWLHTNYNRVNGKCQGLFSYKWIIFEYKIYMYVNLYYRTYTLSKTHAIWMINGWLVGEYNAKDVEHLDPF